MFPRALVTQFRRTSPVLLLLLLAAVPFARALAGRRTLYERDIASYVFGQNESLVRCAAGGAWPLWNPYLGLGHPLLADPGLQVLYPPTWLNFLASVETSYALYAAGHVLLAGLGMLLLGRELRLRGPARLLSACVYMLSGPLLSSVVTWQHLAGAAWLPCVLGAQERALRRRTAGAAAAWGAALAAQVLSGSADMVALGAVPAALLVARRVLRPRPLARARGVARAASVAGVLAAGLTAALWVPAAELLSRTERLAQPETLRLFFSVHPLLAAQALLPVDFVALRLSPEMQDAVLGPMGPLLSSLYLGLACAPLVVLSLFARRRRLALLFAALGGLGLLLALGRYGGLLPTLQDLLPPLRIFRFPAKTTVLCSLAWAVLAGIGLDRRRRHPAAAAVALWVALAAALLAAGAAGSVAAGLLPSSAPRPQALHLLAAAASVAAGGAAIRRRGPWTTHALLAVAALDLTAAHAGLNPTVRRELVARPPATLAAMDRRAPTRVFSFEYEGRSPYLSYRRTLFSLPALQPGILDPHEALALGRNLALAGTIPARWGLYGSLGFDAVVAASREQHELTLLLRSVEETPAFLRLLQLAGVQYVLAFHSEGLEPLRPVAQVATPYVLPLVVYRVPDPLERAFVVEGSRVAADAQATSVLLDPAFDPRREVVLSAGTPREPAPGFTGEVSALQLGCDRVTADVQLNREGYLVLLDAFDAGWRGRVDGAPVQPVRANIAFRAMPLPAGRHRVELAYRPASAWAGAGLTALTLVVLGAALLTRGLRRARARRFRSPFPDRAA